MMKISELQVKDIVNMDNGKRLGHLTDLEINLKTGAIDALVINSSGKMMGLFGKESEEVVIPWKNIIRIGSDVILVEVPNHYGRSPQNQEQHPSTMRKR
ncbi:YlmC/YmxH family sporulation protein [Alkalihalobacillus sp. MEB130]|uniref:YlmC/YmxH family sporulation protein n=1 Tax=Alkalihalobacillus sp. MEB130 TaxID=2976704 RepID=UPI0028DDE3BA|nr:YlmC/YmxH family sporulation protein [Alkalihalobacillus sp. MEB130]MDT8859109.1 YlmC/YmxH family sporulation protein [Alkalihalobacillus sp. MEB130]